MSDITPNSWFLKAYLHHAIYSLSVTLVEHLRQTYNTLTTPLKIVSDPCYVTCIKLHAMIPCKMHPTVDSTAQPTRLLRTGHVRSVNFISHCTALGARAKHIDRMHSVNRSSKQLIHLFAASDISVCCFFSSLQEIKINFCNAKGALTSYFWWSQSMVGALISCFGLKIELYAKGCVIVVKLPFGRIWVWQSLNTYR